MRRWLVALGGVTVTIAGVLLWRRRRRSLTGPSVHLGLEDGGTVIIDEADPAVPELLELAAGLRHQLEIGG